MLRSLARLQEDDDVNQLPTNIKQLVELAIRHCHRREPEGLDRIFDTVAEPVKKQVLSGTLARLQGNAEDIAWLCSYFASETNRSEDNQKTHRPVMQLARVFVESGMIAFQDFMPYSGCRLAVINKDKFEALSSEIKAKMASAYNVLPVSMEQFQRSNEAILKELVVGLD
jgi:hypothetical protein